MARTQETHRTTQKHVEHQDATDFQKKLIFYVFRSFLFLNYFYIYVIS